MSPGICFRSRFRNSRQFSTKSRQLRKFAKTISREARGDFPDNSKIFGNSENCQKSARSAREFSGGVISFTSLTSCSPLALNNKNHFFCRDPPSLPRLGGTTTPRAPGVLLESYLYPRVELCGEGIEAERTAFSALCHAQDVFWVD